MSLKDNDNMGKRTMLAKKTIISGIVEGTTTPILVTGLSSLGLYLINWWAGILLGIVGILLGRLIGIAINRNMKEVIVNGLITSVTVFAGVSWIYWYIFQLRLTASIGGLTAIERAENFLELIGMNSNSNIGEMVIEAFINADLGFGAIDTSKLVKPMCTIMGGIFAGATICVTILVGLGLVLIENKKKKGQEKLKAKEEIRQKLWKETSKKKREEPKEIMTGEITEEMITELRKTIGSEKKVSIEWVQKVTLYKEEVIKEIATKELGMRIENGTLILKKE